MLQKPVTAKVSTYRFGVSGGANTVYFWRLQNHLS